jgi:NDP-sugar pyrophosphorylase family protein|tara:strand:+ start:540 stop:713 length:174 start_codon:yes stop_codon:yes gene_type:complete
LIDFIPKDTYFNATDFIEKLINENKKVLNYSIKNYWLDEGSHEDFLKAQEEIPNFKL